MHEFVSGTFRAYGNHGRGLASQNNVVTGIASVDISHHQFPQFQSFTVSGKAFDAVLPDRVLENPLNPAARPQGLLNSIPDALEIADSIAASGLRQAMISSRPCGVRPPG
jgi:hypothetical protein